MAELIPHLIRHVNDLSAVVSAIIDQASHFIDGNQFRLTISPQLYSESCSEREWSRLVAMTAAETDELLEQQLFPMLNFSRRELILLKGRDGPIGIISYSGTPILQTNGPKVNEFIEAAGNVLQIALDLYLQSKEISNLKKELCLKEEQFQSIADHLPNLALMSCDSDGKICHWNKAGEKIYGYSSAEVMGKDLCELIVPAPFQEEERDRICKTLLTGKPTQLERREAIRRNGTSVTVLSSSAAIMSSHDEPKYFRLDVNICHQIELEERIRQVEKMDALGRLAGGVAHDFNNQLTGIIGLAELIANRERDPALKQFAETILTTAVHSADLASQLLAFSRKRDSERERLDLHELIEETGVLLKRSLDKRINLDFQLDAEHAVIGGDAGQLQTVLLNLAVNARDAMPDGGRLTFSTRIIDVPEATFEAQEGGHLPAGPYILLSVRDTGSGIPLHVQPHIFEPFFTTKDPGKGTGLGLSAVYGTVRAHAGTITIRSLPGTGSTFELLFPLVTKDETTKESANEITEEFQLAPAARILIVDDEDVVRQTAEEVLQQLGHQVVSCADGMEAVNHYRTDWNNIDIVILDMMMPQMSGRDTFHALREINPNIKVLLASGYAPDGEIRHVLDDGVNGFIQKPFLVRELAESLGSLLN